MRKLRLFSSGLGQTYLVFILGLQFSPDFSNKPDKTCEFKYKKKYGKYKKKCNITFKPNMLSPLEDAARQTLKLKPLKTGQYKKIGIEIKNDIETLFFGRNR